MGVPSWENNWEGLFEEEMRAFDARRGELTQTHLGQYALVKGSEIITIMKDEGDAINVGYLLEKHGIIEQPFMVKKIWPFDRPVVINSLRSA